MKPLNIKKKWRYTGPDSLPKGLITGIDFGIAFPEHFAAPNSPLEGNTTLHEKYNGIVARLHEEFWNPALLLQYAELILDFHPEYALRALLTLVEGNSWMNIYTGSARLRTEDTSWEAKANFMLGKAYLKGKSYEPAKIAFATALKKGNLKEKELEECLSELDKIELAI